MTLEVPSNEEELINELRIRLGSIITDEMYEDDNVFRRFLTARNYDVNAAETMLRKHIIWRKKNNVDRILYDYTPLRIGEKYLPRTILGFDKEGAPLVYVDFGNLDTRGLIKSCTKREVIRFVIHHFESEVIVMKKQTAKLGKLIDKNVFIFNLDDLPLATATHKAALDVIAFLIRMYDANYPERLKTAYIINASSYFTLVWGVLKPFLTGRTFQKIKIFGKDGWKDELLKVVDPDVLPAFLGGTRTDPDGNPMCKTFVIHGEKVPAKYFFDKNNQNRTEIPNAKRLVLTRMSKEEVKLKVIYPGSSIEWMFETKSKDIAFSLYYKENENQNSKSKELIPKQRVETDITPETGTFLCETPGIYIIEFDNTYSWIYQKELYYSASVISPNNQNLIIPE